MNAFTAEASCQLVSKTHTSDVDAESAQLAPSGAAGTGGEVRRADFLIAFRSLGGLERGSGGTPRASGV